jgi:hypothetical protein
MKIEKKIRGGGGKRQKLGKQDVSKGKKIRNKDR